MEPLEGKTSESSGSSSVSTKQRRIAELAEQSAEMGISMPVCGRCSTCGCVMASSAALRSEAML